MLANVTRGFYTVLALIVVVGCQSKGNAALEAKYKAARDSVKVGDAWDASVAKVEKALGGKAQVTSDTDMRWAVVDGDDCYDVRLMKRGASVMGVMGGHVNSGVPDRFGRCKDAAAGK